MSALGPRIHRSRPRSRKCDVCSQSFESVCSAGGEPLLCVAKPAREIHPSSSAASNRLQQAAPGNDPAFLLAKAIDSGFGDELRRGG